MPKKSRRTPPPLTHRLQDALLRFRRQLDELTILSDRLRKLGIRNTYLHLRKGNKMIAYDPSNNGQRVYHYIGTDPAAQQQARDDVARYAYHMELQQQQQRNATWLSDWESELDELLERIIDRLDELDPPAIPDELLKLKRRPASMPARARRRRGHKA